MSVAVDLAALPAAIAAQIGWCYLLTVSDDGQARVLAVAPQVSDDGALMFEVGKGTAGNVAARPSITVVYPPAVATAMSLIVDGTATVDGSSVTLVPTWAVMHRSAVPHADQ
ncbi:MAG: hypothetical protein JWL72_2149 [Ilumatobacteraceae bacterium]|nr:hypothetical protein [Ilumatobacteraceae bacterium]MCU1388811.1 hypothetical protein [Ilumatobacteraceae bacterium]